MTRGVGLAKMVGKPQWSVEDAPADGSGTGEASITMALTVKPAPTRVDEKEEKKTIAFKMTPAALEVLLEGMHEAASVLGGRDSMPRRSPSRSRSRSATPPSPRGRPTRRHDSSDSGGRETPARRRHDSSSSGGGRGAPARRVRHDSSSSGGERRPAAPPARAPVKSESPMKRRGRSRSRSVERRRPASRDDRDRRSPARRGRSRSRSRSTGRRPSRDRRVSRTRRSPSRSPPRRADEGRGRRGSRERVARRRDRDERPRERARDDGRDHPARRGSKDRERKGDAGRQDRDRDRDRDGKDHRPARRDSRERDSGRRDRDRDLNDSDRRTTRRDSRDRGRARDDDRSRSRDKDRRPARRDSRDRNRDRDDRDRRDRDRERDVRDRRDTKDDKRDRDRAQDKDTRRDRRRDASASSSSSSGSSSASSSSTDSAERRARKEKKAAKKAKKKEKKMMKKLEAEGKKEGEYMVKLGKGIGKVFEGNSKMGRGRPLSLVKAGLTSALQIALGVEKDGDNVKSRVLPPGDERLVYLSNLNYGSELLQRMGFEEIADKADKKGYTLKDKYAKYAGLAVEMLRESLVSATAKIESETEKVIDDALGGDGLRHLMGGAEPTFTTQKAIGITLGALCGDALGLPFSNWTAPVLDRWFGSITEFHAMPPANRQSDPVPEKFWRVTKPKEFLGTFSGEMAVAVSVAIAVLEAQSIDCKAIPRTIVDEDLKYKGHDRRRMYPEGLKYVITRLAQGVDPKTTGFSLNPSGVKPAEAPQLVTFLALLLKDEESDSVVVEAVKGCLLPFVVHPDGIGVAFVYVWALKHLLHQHSLGEFDIQKFIAFVKEKTGLLVMSDYLMRSLNALEDAFDPKRGTVDPRFLQEIVDDEDDEVSETTFDSAIGAFCGALYAFINHYREPVRAVSAAVHLGETANTMGALVGALCGALHGAEWVPRCWYTLLENGDGRSTAGVGRDRIIQVALDCCGAVLGKTRNMEAPQKYVAPKAALPKKAEQPAAPAKAKDSTSAIKPEAPPTGADRYVTSMPLSMQKYARNKFEVKGV